MRNLAFKRDTDKEDALYVLEYYKFHYTFKNGDSRLTAVQLIKYVYYWNRLYLAFKKSAKEKT